MLTCEQGGSNVARRGEVCQFKRRGSVRRSRAIVHPMCEIRTFFGKTMVVMPKTASKSNRAPATNKPAKLLNDERYRRLLDDVKTLLDQAHRAEDRTRVSAHWNLGRRISRERLRSEAGYHNSVLRDLSAGAGVAKRTLQYAVKLHASYPECPKTTLSLRHYRALLDCPSALRDHYEQLALDEPLNASELRQRIVHDQRVAAGESTLLPRPADPTYLFRVAVNQIVDGDTLDLRIDVGFEMSRNSRFRLAAIDCPELPAADARRARDFVYQRLSIAKTIVVKSERADLHGRYVTHLFYSAEALSIFDCFTQGIHLNAELLNAGHAKLVA